MGKTIDSMVEEFVHTGSPEVFQYKIWQETK